MTHEQALLAIADALEQLDKDRVEEPYHIARTDGEVGYIIMTRQMYGRLVKRIYDLQGVIQRHLPDDEQLLEELKRDHRKGMH